MRAWWLVGLVGCGPCSEAVAPAPEIDWPPNEEALFRSAKKGRPVLPPGAASLPPYWRCELDQATERCLVELPAGTVRMGAQASDPAAPGYDPDALPGEGPVRDVAVPAWRVHNHEVAFSTWVRCVDAGSCAKGKRAVTRAGNAAEYPVTNLTWAEADGLCRFLGLRLLPEEVWTWAARGDDGRMWPWGDHAQCPDGSTEGCARDHLSPVAEAGGDSPFGIVGLAGNAREWTATAEGDLRVQRGGSFFDDDPVDLRISVRVVSDADLALSDVGLRCGMPL